MLLTVSAAHRHVAMRQFFIQQIVTWVTVLALLVAHIGAPSPPSGIGMWFLAFVITWLLRMALFYPLYRIAPAELATRQVLRWLPLLTGLMGNAFWIWTIPRFSGPDMVMQQLIMGAGFFCISIAMTGMWPVTPLTSLSYYVVLWGTFSYHLWAQNHTWWPAIFALNVLVAVMLIEYVQSSIGQVQAQIRRKELDDAHEELKALKDQALAELAHRSSYFRYASHDLRQRLYAIRLWVSSAMTAAQGHRTDAVALSRIAEQVDDLEGYFSKILDYARMEAVELSVQPTVTRVQAILQRLDLRFEHLSIDHRVDLRVRPSPFSILVDQGMLLRIMENLVENAVAHCRNAVLVGARRRGPSLCLDVIDDGLGIPSAAQERIFEPYYQHPAGKGSRHGVRRGAGLGLAIVKELAQQMNVTIELTSFPGSGTRFRVVVPCTPYHALADDSHDTATGAPV
ncbi:MAG: HAMP domain-containing histidine kinase [Proteobacteria bacterium]|nr:HAMP domain-containing histidine kinase [Pseudomonadota bacterium]